MVLLTTTPATLTSYVNSCRTFINVHRPADPQVIQEFSAVCTELEKLAFELDQHSLRLSYGNCSPEVLISIFAPSVLQKLPAIDVKVSKAVRMVTGSSYAAEAVKECYNGLKTRARKYEGALKAALTRGLNQAWGYEANAKFLYKLQTLLWTKTGIEGALRIWKEFAKWRHGKEERDEEKEDEEREATRGWAGLKDREEGEAD